MPARYLSVSCCFNTSGIDCLLLLPPLLSWKSNFSHAHASVHVMCHLLSEFLSNEQHRKFLSTSVSCVSLVEVCEWGKFSSNYRSIASFPSQHFDCCKKFTFSQSFIHKIHSPSESFSQHFTHIAHSLACPSKPRTDEFCACLVISDASALAQVNESKIDSANNDDVLRAFDRTAPCPVDSSQLWRLSWSDICCLLIFCFVCFSMYKYSNLYVTSGVKRWNYYCLARVSRDAFGELPQIMSPIRRVWKLSLSP